MNDDFKKLLPEEQRLAMRTLEVLPKLTTLCMFEGLTDEDKAAVRISLVLLKKTLERVSPEWNEAEFTTLGFLVRELGL